MAFSPAVFPCLSQGKLEEKELKEFLKNMDAETAMKLSKAMDAAGTKGGNLSASIDWNGLELPWKFHCACLVC